MYSISYQGICGSFSHQASILFFNTQNFNHLPADFVGVDRFHKIFDNVLSNKTTFGMVPIENSTAGSIIENYDLLRESGLKVVGEVNLSVKHQLVGLASSDLTTIKKIYTHPKAFEQCERFLENFPDIERITYSDTAGAGKFVADNNDPTLAAICSSTAADLYNLKIIAANIHDTEINTTRFLVINENSIDENKGEKCSVIFELPHIPGTLLSVFQILFDYSANVTKIESRPNYQKKFEYFFYLDFELKTDKKEELLEKLSDMVINLNILGWYESSVN